MKQSNKEFVLSVFPNACVYQGVGARYVILAEPSNSNGKILSNVCATENSAWKAATQNIKAKEA